MSPLPTQPVADGAAITSSRRPTEVVEDLGVDDQHVQLLVMAWGDVGR